MLRTIHTLKFKKKKVNEKSGMTSLSFEKSKKKKKSLWQECVHWDSKK